MLGTASYVLAGGPLVTPSQKSLTLPATPRAVRLAREWVHKVLTELGRPELVDSAELGVSELVTNAMLHSMPPVVVRVRGTREHPRVEVADRSLVPPRLIDALRRRGGPAVHLRPRALAGRAPLGRVGIRARPRRTRQDGLVRTSRGAARGHRSRRRSVRHRRGDGAPALRGGARGDDRDPAARNAGGRFPRPPPALPRAAARAAAAGAHRPRPLPVRRRALRRGDAGGAGAAAEPGGRAACPGRGRQRGGCRPPLRHPGVRARHHGPPQPT